MPVVDPVTAASFADSLLDGGDPFNALTWYRLSLHLSGEDNPAAPSLRFRAALCYELGDRHDAAEAAYLDLAERFAEWSPRATYRAGMAAREGGHPGMARVHFEEVLLEDPTGPWADRSAYMAAVLTLQFHDLERTRRELDAFAERFPESELIPRVDALRPVLAEPVRHRSPTLAGVFSAVVPGTGQLHARHWGDGVMAFVTSAGSAGLAYSLIRYGVEDERAWATSTGTVFAVLSSFLWVSQVVGAVRGARRANDLWLHQHIDDVLEEAMHPELEVYPEDVHP